MAFSFITSMLGYAHIQHNITGKPVCAGMKCIHADKTSSVIKRVTKGMLQSWDNKRQGPVDPFAIAEPEIDSISERLRSSLLTDIPALGKAAEYFFQACCWRSKHWSILTALMHAG